MSEDIRDQGLTRQFFRSLETFRMLNASQAFLTYENTKGEEDGISEESEDEEH